MKTVIDAPARVHAEEPPIFASPEVARQAAMIFLATGRTASRVREQAADPARLALVAGSTSPAGLAGTAAFLEALAAAMDALTAGGITRAAARDAAFGGAR